MKLKISEAAADWLIQDMVHAPGSSIRFFVRLGGCSTVQSGFSLGVTKDDPKHPHTETQIKQTRFFIEEEDVWFFDGHDLIVDLDEQNGDLIFSYTA